MKHFSDSSCYKMLGARHAIDKAMAALGELPESERLGDVIEQLSAAVARLAAILKDESF